MQGKRYFFAGANSGRGFFSFFHNIVGPETKRVYLLKGGPGTGKSRFIKDLVKSLAGRGFNHELFFCSSDPDSLDAAAFPELGVAIIDATRPHAIEAEWPGCRDELIYLGDFWSSQGLMRQREEIIARGIEKQRHFAAAFSYLEAARHVEEAGAMHHEATDVSLRAFSAQIQALFDQARIDYTVPLGKARRLFAAAFTPQGYVSHIGGLVDGYRNLYVLSGPSGVGKSACLQRLVTYAQEVGFDSEVLHYPLDPHKIMHVLVPELSLALLTSHYLDPLTELAGMRVNLGPGINESENSQGIVQELLGLATTALQDAQKTHQAAEALYREQMDFGAVEACRARILEEILALEELALIVSNPTEQGNA